MWFLWEATHLPLVVSMVAIAQFSLKKGGLMWFFK
jgi:hypothetical protein